MPRGGFRVGAGRPKGSKKNRTTTKATKTITGPGAGNLTPLAYMLQVMNDESEDPDMRARMAIAAAPYVHPKAGEGKKQDRADRAKKAGTGKFSQGKPPFKVVK